MSRRRVGGTPEFGNSDPVRHIRVALSATNLRVESIGGGETYVVGLANALARRHDIECAVVSSADENSRVRSLFDERVTLLPTREFRGTSRIARDLLMLDRALRDWGADVFHYPHEWTPITSVPVVLTIQNVIWLDPRSRAWSGGRGMLLRALTRATSRRANAVVAVSSHAGDLWARHTGVRVSSPPIPEGFSDDEANADRTVLPQGSYILGVAGAARHKNTELMLAAHEALTPGMAPPLVVAGVDGAIRSRQRFLGRVGHGSLLALMRHSSCVAFPSTVESFGLPALEAAAVGARCVVGEGSPMHEWLSDAVVPTRLEPPLFATALARALDLGPLPDDAVAEIRTRFSWDRVAEAMTRVYIEAIRRGS